MTMRSRSPRSARRKLSGVAARSLAIDSGERASPVFGGGDARRNATASGSGACSTIALAKLVWPASAFG